MTATRRIATLTFADLFGKKTALNSRELKKLHALGEPVRFRLGESIIAEGEVANDVYGLSRGVVRIYKTLPDGERCILRFALPGEFLELPHGKYHSVSAAAIGSVSLSRFQKAEFVEFVRSSRNMTRSMMDIAANDLKHAQDHMLIVGKAAPEEKIIAFIKTWRKHFPRGIEKHVSLPMPRRDIAAHLGMAPETVTRAFAALEQKKVVRVVKDGIELLKGNK